jgi:hypothetical protein
MNRGKPIPRGAGDADLSEAVTKLLKTPTSQLASNGGSQDPVKRRAGGHGPTLDDEVSHLLPTVRTGDNRNSRVAVTGANSGRHGRTARGSASGLGLEQALEVARGEVPRELLPTPEAAVFSPTPWKPGLSTPQQSMSSKSLAAIASGTAGPLNIGEGTGPRSAFGSVPPDGQLPAQLSLDELGSQG